MRYSSCSTACFWVRMILEQFERLPATNQWGVIVIWELDCVYQKMNLTHAPQTQNYTNFSTKPPIGKVLLNEHLWHLMIEQEFSTSFGNQAKTLKGFFMQFLSGVNINYDVIKSTLVWWYFFCSEKIGDEGLAVIRLEKDKRVLILTMGHLKTKQQLSSAVNWRNQQSRGWSSV